MGSLPRKLAVVVLSAVLAVGACPAAAFAENAPQGESVVAGSGDSSALPEASVSTDSVATELAATPASDFEYAVGSYLLDGKVRDSLPDSFVVDEKVGASIDGHTTSAFGLSGYDCGYGVYITRYVGSGSSIVIPESINGVDVVCVDLYNPGLSIEVLDVSQCTNLKALDCFGLTIGSVDFGDIASVQNVLFTQSNISSLIEMKGLVDLRELAFYISNFSEFTLDGSNLESVFCGITNANSLDFSGCQKLTSLTCTNNQFLTSLRVASCPTLKRLSCNGNALKALDVSGCDTLAELYCQENRIADTSALEAWLAQGGHSGQVLPQNAASEAATRLGGANRYSTMSLVSKTAFPQDGSCQTVVVARGDNFPDALAAAGLAGVTGGQVLLTETSSLTDETKAEIKRLGARKAYVIGDEHSVTARTFNEVKTLTGDATRLGGADRLDTAVKIYEAGKGSWGSTAIVATGKKAADSLSVSPIAYALKAPIFLADNNGGLSQGALDAIAKGGFTRVLVLGDANSVSKAAFDKVKALAGFAERIGGADRYQTSQLTAEWALENGFTCASVSLTAGREGKFADALVASSLGGRNTSPLLLVDDGTAGSVCISKVLAPNKVQVAAAYVLGDTYTVSDKLHAAIKKALA